jgi:enediyne biosynthesis protein E4
MMHVCGRSLALFTAAVVVMNAAADEQPERSATSVRFRNVADAAGLRFVHSDSPMGSRYFVDSAPGGLAVFDYNGDGRPDIFFTNGAETPSLQKASPAYFNRLFRNDGNMQFTDVTDIAGVRGVGYAMGAAAADYDNDGHVDLFVAGVRQNQLLHNRGDGRFEDVTKQSGIASGEWAVAAGWFDYDNDGRLDLLVVNYVQWSVEANRSCGEEGRGVQIYCDPRVFKGLPNRLYRNRGDGTFEDVSEKAGLLSHVGKGMSAAFADFNHDGRLDVFITNDTVPNFLFRNNGDGTFTEDALMAGVSVTGSGRPISSMGTDAQDYDNDGWPDIHMTALAGETFPLFRNDSHGAFIEETQASGLGRLTVRLSGWCSIVADMDNDGWKDIFTANSHVNARIGDFEAIAFKQPNSLFLNDGQGHVSDVSGVAGLGSAVAAHRGCGVADFDGDGRLDIVVLTLGTPAELWHNTAPTSNHWAIVRLVGTKTNRDGIGAQVRIGKQVRTMTTSMGYASSSHAGLHFGLGSSADPVRIEVEWPSGVKQTIDNVTIDRVVEIKESSAYP